MFWCILSGRSTQNPCDVLLAAIFGCCTFIRETLLIQPQFNLICYYCFISLNPRLLSEMPTWELQIYRRKAIRSKWTTLSSMDEIHLGEFWNTKSILSPFQSGESNEWRFCFIWIRNVNRRFKKKNSNKQRVGDPDVTASVLKILECNSQLHFDVPEINPRCILVVAVKGGHFSQRDILGNLWKKFCQLGFYNKFNLDSEQGAPGRTRSVWLDVFIYLVTIFQPFFLSLL